MFARWRAHALGSALVTATIALSACSGDASFDPKEPSRGPGQQVGLGEPITDGLFPGGQDAIPARRNVTPPADGVLPDCDADCQSYCAQQSFANPIHEGMCENTWGVGLSTQPIQFQEACRRLFVDTVGVFPTAREMGQVCQGSWGDIVKRLIDDERFVALNQRRWADKLAYDTEAVSVERIFDMDVLVGKLYQGLVPFDQFAAVASAHPVITRRFDTPGDRAEALFTLFMGRPPLGNERSDLARLYSLWYNGYYDHPELALRLPDAWVEYDCLTEDFSAVDEATKGGCTSILWGYNELILLPDIRAIREDETRRMWSGLLREDEWAKLQLPGQLLSREVTFWEHAVDEVLQTYLGYDIGIPIPSVRDKLVGYLLEHEGDIRSVHFAVLTSAAYLQTATGTTDRNFRWTFGPLKQVDAEVWIDTIRDTTGYDLTGCDWRINRPEDFLESGTIAGYSLIKNSRWTLDDSTGEVRGQYRQLARTIGGCPSNDVGGRFRIVSILTTATQLGFVNQVCAPGRTTGAPVERLLPDGIGPRRAVDGAMGEQIVEHQTKLFYGREPTEDERADARRHGESCARTVCSAEEFARPSCFALLSSSEMLFY